MALWDSHNSIMLIANNLQYKCKTQWTYMNHLSITGPLIEGDNILKDMQNACLVIHVYCEKLKEDSFWKPYLGILHL